MDILPKMQYQAIVALQSVAKKINLNKRKHCFELFGLDFMVDSAFDCWIIEVNTNPCLEETSTYLKSILPRLIDDMLHLTLD